MIICKIRRAAVQRKCEICKLMIKVGQTYARHSFPPDDILPYWRSYGEHVFHRHPEELKSP